MDRWPGKYVIGLTGSIGTGKSVVRRMLENLGGLGIDADALAHRVYARGTRGNAMIVGSFGREVLDGNGEVDRQKLAKMVFANPNAMTELEGIVHPLVISMVNAIIARATQPVIIIEAIKLLETELAIHCDAIWVVTASPEVQLQRLVRDRHMSEEAARSRIDAQIPQESRLDRANVVIQNDGTLTETWLQVVEAWKGAIPVAGIVEQLTQSSFNLPVDGMRIENATPDQAAEISDFSRIFDDELSPERILTLFAQQSYLLLKKDGHLMGIMGWKIQNFVAQGLDFFLDSSLPVSTVISLLMCEMERQSLLRQCEVSMIFLKPEKKSLANHLRKLGYRRKQPVALEKLAWRNAAETCQISGAGLFFKHLGGDLPASSI